MRAHTSLRTAFRFGLMMAATAGVSFAASQAHADTAQGVGIPDSSTGTAALKFDYNQSLDTDISTPWVGPDVAQVRALIKIEPVKGAGPLYSVDMQKGAVLEARWTGDKKIILKAANGTQNDGTIKVKHSLSPSLEVKFRAGGLAADFSWNATTLLNKVPGAQFAYSGNGSQLFAPWGFTPIETKVNAVDLANSTLFELNFSAFSEYLDPAEYVGSIGVRATTRPTFSYKTTNVMILGSTAPITAAAGESVIDAIDGDFMDVMAQVEGIMDVKGAIAVEPFIKATRILGYGITTNIAIPVANVDYTVPTSKVAYQATMVHIPLPNVHAPTKGYDLGAVKAGGSATKNITIQNSGEKAATVNFKSSDPQVAVPGGTITIQPKAKYDMQVKLTANNEGPTLSTITVQSNDPDSPVQTFKVGANGADVGPTADEDEDGDGLPGSAPSVDESGCGCKTAGSTTQTGGWAALGALGLGLVFAARRRRTAA